MTDTRGRSPGDSIQASFAFEAGPTRFDELVVSPANEAAIAFLSDGTAWPHTATCLIGPPKSGRTTLAHIWASRHGGQVISASDLMAIEAQKVGQHLGRALAVDPGADSLDSESVMRLFHLAAEAGAPLLLTGDIPPHMWPTESRDVESRLAAIPVIELHNPDDDMLAARVVRGLGRHYIDVPDEIVRFLAPRLKRAYADIEACVTRMAGLAGPERNLTVAVARQALTGMYGHVTDEEEGQGDV